MPKGFIKMPCNIEMQTAAPLVWEKIDNVIMEQGDIWKQDMRGVTLFLLKKEGKGITVDYHQSFKKDICEYTFRGEIIGLDDKCQLVGEIRKSRSMTIFCIIWCIIGFIVSFLTIPFTYSLNYFFVGLFITLAVLVMSLHMDKDKTQAIFKYLGQLITI